MCPMAESVEKVRQIQRIIKNRPSKHKPRSMFFQCRAFCDVTYFITFHPLGFSTDSHEIYTEGILFLTTQFAQYLHIFTTIPS
jgi:hypothetical protein